MCLITAQKEPLTAEEDIVVYKILRKSLSSIYHTFSYEINVLNKTSLVKSNDRIAYDRRSTDALREEFEDFDFWSKYKLNLDITVIGEGFHFAFSKERLLAEFDSRYDTIVKCIVPKDSLYFKDKDELGVSNQIIITEIL